MCLDQLEGLGAPHLVRGFGGSSEWVFGEETYPPIQLSKNHVPPQLKSIASHYSSSHSSPHSTNAPADHAPPPPTLLFAPKALNPPCVPWPETSRRRSSPQRVIERCSDQVEMKMSCPSGEVGGRRSHSRPSHRRDPAAKAEAESKKSFGGGQYV